MAIQRLIGLFLVLSVFPFVQCHQCHDEELSSMAFSQDDIKINPYSDSDTIKFISSSNDSIILYGSRKTEKEVIHENTNESDELALYHCLGQWYYSQINSTIFSDSNDFISIRIFLSLPDIFHDSLYSKTITFIISPPDKSAAQFDGIYQFENDSFSTLGNPEVNGKIEGYQDTLTLGQKTFYNIYKFYNIPDSYTQSKYSDWVERIYYSIKEGIVGFSLKSGKYYVENI